VSGKNPLPDSDTVARARLVRQGGFTTSCKGQLGCTSTKRKSALRLLWLAEMPNIRFAVMVTVTEKLPGPFRPGIVLTVAWPIGLDAPVSSNLDSVTCS